MTSKEFSLLIDLMLSVSKKAGEGELTRILEKYQQTPDTEVQQETKKVE